MRKAVTKWLLGLAILGLAGLIAPANASASSIVDYTITGTLNGSLGPLSFTDSSIDINTTTGLATDASITIDGIPISGAPTVDTSTEYEWCPYGCSLGYLELTDSSGFQNLGTSGSSIGTVTISWFGTYTDSGTLTLTDAPASTPEPPTVLLLAIGLLGLLVGSKLLRRPQLGLAQKQQLA